MVCSVFRSHAHWHGWLGSALLSFYLPQAIPFSISPFLPTEDKPLLIFNSVLGFSSYFLPFPANLNWPLSSTSFVSFSSFFIFSLSSLKSGAPFSSFSACKKKQCPPCFWTIIYWLQLKDFEKNVLNIIKFLWTYLFLYLTFPSITPCYLLLEGSRDHPI